MDPAQKPDRPPGMQGMAKAGAYMGLAFVTPIAGFLGYFIGRRIDLEMGTSWVDIAGLLFGCVAGMYETFRQALRIEGLESLGKKKK